jgi:hypothetical protein
MFAETKQRIDMIVILMISILSVQDVIGSRKKMIIHAISAVVKEADQKPII